jgi:hypothetical protein
VAMMVVLIGDATNEFCLREELVASLSRLGVTNLAVVRDARTVGIVVEGWLFDPVRSAGAAAEAVGATSGARVLHPVLQLAVSTATTEGGRDVEQVS